MFCSIHRGKLHAGNVKFHFDVGANLVSASRDTSYYFSANDLIGRIKRFSSICPFLMRQPMCFDVFVSHIHNRIEQINTPSIIF